MALSKYHVSFSKTLLCRILGDTIGDTLSLLLQLFTGITQGRISFEAPKLGLALIIH